MKLALVLAAVVSSVGFAISMVMVFCVSSVVSSGDVFEPVREHYEDTNVFARRLGWDAQQILEYLDKKDQFETEGQYDPDKVVDILTYADGGGVSGVNESGLSYRLGDLVEWGRERGKGNYDGYEARGIVVCKKTDGTYAYYYREVFRQKVTEGELNLYMGDVAVPKFGALEQEFFTELENGEFELLLFPKQYSYDMQNQQQTEESMKIIASGRLNLRDAEGNPIYVDCWVIDRVVTDLFKPIGAESLLQAVEQSPGLNGRLSEVNDKFQVALSNINSDAETYLYNGEQWDEGNTNLFYLFVDHGAKRVFSNNREFSNYGKWEDYVSTIKKQKNCKYVIVEPEREACESNVDVVAVGKWAKVVDVSQSMTADYTYMVGIDTSYPVTYDDYATAAAAYERWAPYHKLWVGAAVFCAVVFAVALIWLTMVAGRKDGDEELHLNAFDRWKTELGALAAIIPWFVLTAVALFGLDIMQGWRISEYDRDVSYYTETLIVESKISLYGSDLLTIGIYAALVSGLFLMGYLSLVRRVKGKTLWKNSLLRAVARGVREFAGIFWENQKLTLRAAMTVAGFGFLHWLLAYAAWEHVGSLFYVMVFVLAADMAAMLYAVKSVAGRQRVREGVEEMSSGNANYKVQTQGLTGTDRDVAEKLNNIGDGIRQAVEAAVKSERLKTDLITNVSHDIKTPLTSIINYVDLLKRENFENPKIRGYLEILDEKSQRLKTLTEDVVEASKVNSGNISLEFMNVNLVEMILQTIGETSEKMEKRNLEVIANLPETPVAVSVDGRRMWRVLENIFNNAAKYAMPGTRVYADLQVVDRKAVFSLKNVSEQPLNIHADELTERFIRGDVARSTEGSGLGLSIAKSLTQLQGGTFELYLDGDLFKVIIVFDVKEEARKKVDEG